MKKSLVPFIFALMLSVFLWNPAVLLAGEHGGKEHGGKEHGGEEHGGMTMEGSHHHGDDTAGTIREAASILKAAHPDLAAELERIAEEEEEEEEEENN